MKGTAQREGKHNIPLSLATCYDLILTPSARLLTSYLTRYDNVYQT